MCQCRADQSLCLVDSGNVKRSVKPVVNDVVQLFQLLTSKS